MASDDPCHGFDTRDRTIDDIHQELFSATSSCRQIVEAYLARIVKHNSKINAIISLNPHALAIADELDVSLAAGDATGTLFGIPIILKDNYDTVDMKTTGACLALAESQPLEDAPTTAALRRAGAIILGKASMHELALEGLSVSSLGGQVINPFSAERTPGGSSGGSAAAIAASFAVFATGTDTVNSLRSPASANSLFSCRPTRGLVSRSGIIPISFTQDAPGPIARTVKDVAIALRVMASAGFDTRDDATALVPPSSVNIDYAATVSTGSLKGLRLGLVEGFFNREDSTETTPVNDAMDGMMSVLQDSGATIVRVNEPFYDSSRILADLDTQRFEYREAMDAYLRRPGLAGTHPSTLKELYGSGRFLVIPTQYEYINTALTNSTSNDMYEAVQRGIHDLSLAVRGTFRSHNLDALVYPEQKNLVVRIGSPSQAGRNGIVAALTGFPVVTVPAGFSPPDAEAPIGIPIGMEIMGMPWTEEKLLQIAYQVEQCTHVRQAPPWARDFVKSTRLESVPKVVPNTANTSTVYPLGTLSYVAT